MHLCKDIPSRDGRMTTPSLPVTDFSHYFLFVRGTHGYMAPEVLAKGTAYDSSADWFSFGCMLYKLLRGLVHVKRYVWKAQTIGILVLFFSHSPFRQHKTKDKHEIDRMTMTMVRNRLS